MGRLLSAKILIISSALSLACLSCGEFAGFSGKDNPDTGELPVLKIAISEDDRLKLYDSVVSDLYASCFFQEGDQKSRPAKIKIRGKGSIYFPKKSFNLVFEEGGEEVKYALDAGGNPWIRYSLAMYAYGLVGLPVNPFVPIAVYINDEYIGYYNKVLLYNEDLNDHYNAEGELFKVLFSNIGEDYPSESKSEKKFPDDDDFSRLNHLTINAAHMPPEDWVPWIEENVDLKSVACYMVVRDYFSVNDTINYNYYIYFHDKALILPWDSDSAFGYNDIGGNNVLTRRMLESPVFREHYRDIFNSSLFDEEDEQYILNDLRHFVQEMKSLLDPVARVEPNFYMDEQTLQSEYDFLLSFFDRREENIKDAWGWREFFEQD